MNTKAVVMAIALLVSTLGASGVVVAQQEPIYNNSTNGTAEQDQWVDGATEPTLDNITSMVPKGVSYVIAGDAEPNTLVMGILVGLGAVSLVGVGGAGLTVGLVAASFTVMALGVAGIPRWIEALFMIILGVLLSIMYFRWGR